MGDNDRQDAANQAEDKGESQDPDEQTVKPAVKKAPESSSAPSGGDDIIIK